MEADCVAAYVIGARCCCAQQLVTSSAPWGGGVAPRAYGGGNDTSFSFVRVSGSRFTSDPLGAPYYFLGANYWAGMSLGSAGAGGDRARLRADLDALKAAGVTQLRVLGAAEGPDSEPWRIAPSLTPCPGVYNAQVLAGFDYLIAEMGARKMRATVVLGDEWAWSGGHVQYVRWAQALAAANVSASAFTPNASACVPMGVDPATGAPRRPDITSAAWRELGFQNIPYPGPGGRSWSDYQALAGQFYGLPLAQRIWRDHVAFMITHVNAFTGLAARDDPTVMSWQLANEPRAADISAESAKQFLDWLRISAAFIKQLAPRQLVSSGMGACSFARV
jgi:mannan endo-1,4-beta-mannosidase